MFQDQIERVRAFNRFYTNRIGALQKGHLDSDYSLSEARILFEIAHSDGSTAAGLGRQLRLDTGYLSRILAHFFKKGLIERIRDKHDKRRVLLRLTQKGRDEFEMLNSRARIDIDTMLQGAS